MVNILCTLLYLMVFPVMMVIFICYELKYPEYDLFLPYFAMGIVVVLIIGTAAFFFYDPYKQDKKRVKNAKDYISEVEKIAKKQVKKNQKLRAKEEKKNQKIQLRTLEREEAAREKEEKLQSYFITRMEKYLNSKGRNIIGWDEILEGGLAPNATVMSWRGVEGGITAAKAGHDAIMTTSPYAYLDKYQEETETAPTTIG